MAEDKKGGNKKS